MTTTTYTLDENLNKATIVFEIHDFKNLRSRAGKSNYIKSEEVMIRRTAFSLVVFPQGGTEKDKMTVYLHNDSDHDVLVDYSIRAVGGATDNAYRCKIEKRKGWGMPNFMRGNKVEGALKFVVEVKVKLEVIIGATNVSWSEGSRYWHDLIELDAEGMMELTDIDSEEPERLDKVEKKPLIENELESLNTQLMGKETKLHELWNNDRSLVESKGTEMSELLSELEEAEEEKAAIQKQVVEIDAAAKELQNRRTKLVKGIRDKDEKVEKLLRKKNSLENFIEEKVNESRDAKDQLEREIKEIKIKISSLSTVERMPPESNNLKLKWLMESIESRIEAEQKELECPVCFEVASILSLFPDSLV